MLSRLVAEKVQRVPGDPQQFLVAHVHHAAQQRVLQITSQDPFSLLFRIRSQEAQERQFERAVTLLKIQRPFDWFKSRGLSLKEEVRLRTHTHTTL